MSSRTPTIVRVTQGAEWHAVEMDEVVGRARALHRPDRRWFVSFDASRADVYETLLRAVDRDLQESLYTTVDEADRAQLQQCMQLGFTVDRREHEYRVPTGPDATGLGDAVVPAGMSILSAADVDVDLLRALDELLREDVPGSDGWVNDPQEFRKYTFDPRHFNAETYLVAVDEVNGDLAGLARVWDDPATPRLGLIGIVAGYRRCGLARSLLAAAFRPLHERGTMEVAAEADADNAASVTLLSSLGARRTGGSVELNRQHRPE